MKTLRVLPLAVLLAVLSCASRAGTLPQQAAVRRVIDGDTIEVAGGRRIRYIGINAPEVRRRVNGVWEKDPEPFGEAATAANRRLVGGRTVRLEYDMELYDRFGRTLAYVYAAAGRGEAAKTEIFVNEALVREGFAQPMTIPPNVKYAERFRAAAEEARRSGRGLWSGAGR